MTSTRHNAHTTLAGVLVILVVLTFTLLGAQAHARGAAAAPPSPASTFGVGPQTTQPPPPPTCLSAPLVYRIDFEGGVGAEWSNAAADVTPTGRRFLGQFNNEAVSLTLTGLPSHTHITLCFELFVIRSWEGNVEFIPSFTIIGPDVWDLTVLNGRTLLHTTFTNWPDFTQAYPGAFPEDDYPARTEATEVNSLGYQFEGVPMDSVYRLIFSLRHAEDDLTLIFSASGLQTLADESWGLDNVEVRASTATQFLYLPYLLK